LERARLLQALQKYPILRDLFGKEWFLRKLSEKERHVLIELLLEEEPEVEHVKDLFNDLQASLKAGRDKTDLDAIQALEARYSVSSS